jgi:hypothetical protein
MSRQGYTHEVLVFGQENQNEIQILKEVRYLVTGGFDSLTVSGALGLSDTLTISGQSNQTGSTTFTTGLCCPPVPNTPEIQLIPIRTFTLFLDQKFADFQRFRIVVEWDSTSSVGVALGELRREWIVETPKTALSCVAVTFAFSNNVIDPLQGFESLRFDWASEQLEERITQNFILPLYDAPGNEFSELILEGPKEIRFTGLRSWAAPLRHEEIQAHFTDKFSWGTEFPLDEAYTKLQQPDGSEPQFVEDLYDLEENPFQESAWIKQPRSREKELLISAWDSFSLRNIPEQWRNTVTCELWPENAYGGSLEVDHQTFRTNTLDPKWDETGTREKIRTFPGEGRTEISPVEQPAADWRFGIEFSPTSAIDTDLLRGMSELSPIDTWVGAPENLFTQTYPQLRDWQNTYFGRRTVRSQTGHPEIICDEGRLYGPIKYLAAMRLHRWLRMNLKGFIEEMIPFNVDYLGFNNMIEPLATERAKVQYPGADRYLDPLQRLDPLGLRLVVLNALVRRF